MPDYKLGKIYKIVSFQTDLIYYGSTCEKYLSNRFSCHNSHYRKWLINNDPLKYITSFEILKYSDAEIILVESFPCTYKAELEARERYHIELNKVLTVNIKHPTRTHKEYREDHREEIRDKKKKYREEHKEYLREYLKKHQQEKKEERKEYLKTYKEENKEKIKRQQHLKFIASQMKKKMEIVNNKNKQIDQILSQYN